MMQLLMNGFGYDFCCCCAFSYVDYINFMVCRTDPTSYLVVPHLTSE